MSKKLTQYQKNKRAIKATLKRIEKMQENKGFTEISHVYITDEDLEKLARKRRTKGKKRMEWTKLVSDKLKIETDNDYYTSVIRKEGEKTVVKEPLKKNWTLQEYKEFLNLQSKMEEKVYSLPPEKQKFLIDKGYAGTRLSLSTLTEKRYKRIKELSEEPIEEVYEYYAKLTINNLLRSLRNAGLEEISPAFFKELEEALRKVDSKGPEAIKEFYKKYPDLDKNFKKLFSSDNNEETVSAFKELITALEKEGILNTKQEYTYKKKLKNGTEKEYKATRQRVWDKKTFKNIVEEFENGKIVIME